ncbi:hypothetical protein ABEB36_011349 [Hypothenemus hampei]|uniref:LIM zinc-binding domain-containing protein n=1 Tax=Hypothenemus hampei TaxID=57062 RepID=A0ABD1EHY8_HYPHA
MDNHNNEKETERRNTEYIPTKCRVTRPPPPKPATNPMQFVKVAPPPLFKKAQEQIKKVEDIKKERKEIRDETEEWQQNLDNWKSCRRKRQEHIIERVVEVKKLTEQEELEKSKRKSKTFSEMLEERSQKGRPKVSIPIYNDDDSNDLSDYGIGSSSSKINSSKDADTDETSSTVGEKEDENIINVTSKDAVIKSSHDQCGQELKKSPTNKLNAKPAVPPKSSLFNQRFPEIDNNAKQYTYEGAIQDYRSRIQNKIKVDESIFTKKEVNKSKEFSEAQTVLPKGEISKRKGLFEASKSGEITPRSEMSSRRLSEDFANAKSLKDRLKSLESGTDQSVSKIETNEIQLSIKERMANFNKPETKILEPPKPVKISSLLEKTNREPQATWEEDRSANVETGIYFNSDLISNAKLVDENFDYCPSNSNYPPSTSSNELLGIFSDREDSGIHTADVSCSVSQADEPIDTDNDAILNTIPNCIEKLKKTEEEKLNKINDEPVLTDKTNGVLEDNLKGFTREEIVEFTKEFLASLINDATEEIIDRHRSVEEKNKNNLQIETQKVTFPNESLPENFASAVFSLPSTKLEPPKSRPPPLPFEREDSPTKPVKRMNSTKRILKEIHSKRSSFLGLEDTDIELLDPERMIEEPPDIRAFLQKEQKLKKSLYKKIHDEGRVGFLSKVESQDSGLDIDRGRLSSDTWCSSIPSHERQDSEQTNSVSSEEDDLTKKEREIIEMVEQEEKFKNNINCALNVNCSNMQSPKRSSFEPTLGSDQFNNPYFPEQSNHYIDDQDSEVLKVERELRQLEQEELERQRDNMLFRENRNRARLANRHSLDNICDDIYANYANIDYRKSLPNLQDVNMEFPKSVYDKQMQYIGHSTPAIYTYRNSYLEETGFSNNLLVIDHRKSMPELQHEAKRSAFVPPMDRQPIKPSTKPLRPFPSAKPRILTKPSLKALSAIPRNRHTNSWIAPIPTAERQNCNQHWVIQEAERRRLADQSKSNWKTSGKQEKPLPDSVIETITQRVQNRQSLNERNHQSTLRNEQHLNNDHSPIYVNHPQTINHAMPSVPFSPPAIDNNFQDRMLSVSGKKKCSSCNNELGRGAAMIIESLCLFYHMECFKCCVCHIQLGDGRIGTDVRVRNQKLHCHNCYSSEDGIKFSCV